MKKLALLSACIVILSIILQACGKTETDNNNTSQSSQSYQSSENSIFSSETTDDSDISDISDISDVSDVSDVPEKVEGDLNDGYYILTQDIEISFNMDIPSMTINEYNPYSHLISNVVFDNDTMTVIRKFDNEDTTTFEYQYTLNDDGYITGYQKNDESAEYIYDDNNRLSRIIYTIGEESYTYVFFYNEQGFLTIYSSEYPELNYYGYEKFPRLISEESPESIEFYDNELSISASDGTYTYAISKVSEEEYKIFSIWNMISFTNELYLTFERGFIYDN